MKFSTLLIALLAVQLVAAASYTDTLNADFNAGNVSTVNVSSDSVTLASVNATYNNSGAFTSRVFDLGSNPANITISWDFSTPANTSLLVATRSGPNATDFSSWSSYYATSSGSAVTSGLNRYYQYEVLLTTTDNTTTPELDDVTIAYNETGPLVLAAPGLNANLTTSTASPYVFYSFINDTLPITGIEASYRIAAGGFTSTPISPFSPAIYNISIPGGWSAALRQNLTVLLNVTDENASANDTHSFNLTQFIDDTPPVIDPISNYTATQNHTIEIIVTGADFDGQNITYTTNQSDINITVFTSTSAKLSWMPNASEGGLRSIKVYANDSIYTTTKTFFVNVSTINYQPSISAASAITGYHGVAQSLVLTGHDPDFGENISFSISPDFFPIYTTGSIGNSTTFGTYYGIANYTPADPEDGVHNVTFSISDGTYSANTTTTMSISYCGNGACDSSYETATSCPADCAVQRTPDQIALIIPDRNCVNQTSKLYTFNATNRYSCYYEGLVEQGFALCEGVDGVSVTVYYKDGYQLTQMTTLNSGQNGSADFTPDQVGEYKLVASKEGFGNTSAVVTVRDCSENIVSQSTNTTIYQPTTPGTTKPATKPQQQLPELTPQQTNWLSVFIFYFVVPLLLAALIYTGSIFYDVNKDTLPWLLEMRIGLYQQRVKYDPQIQAAKAKLQPIVTPVAESIVALYDSTLRPLIARLRRRKP